MKHDKVKVILFDTDGNLREEVVSDDLDTFHALIKCDTMQGLTYRRIGKVFADLLIDDNGKMYGQDTITAVFVNDQSQVLDVILGNIVFSWHDEDGDTIDVMPNTLAELQKRVCPGRLLITPKTDWKVADKILVFEV